MTQIDVMDGTKTERCDFCQHWSPLSGSRIMGWCEREIKRPIATPAWVILLARQDDDQITAYNQVCQALAQIKETTDGQAD